MSTAAHRHTLFEDAQSLLVAPLLCAFAVLLFREAGLLTGGTIGIAFLIPVSYTHLTLPTKRIV